MSDAGAARPDRPESRWLFGPATDLLLGCGGAYALLLCVLALTGTGAPADEWAGLLVLLAGVPHYGATLTRVLESPEERRKYALVTIGAAVIAGSAFLGGLFNPLVGSALLTLYLCWSPWHYAAQNYGISLMFLGLNRVRIQPFEKKLLRVSFIAPAAMAILSSLSGKLPARSLEKAAETIQFISLGIHGKPFTVTFVVLLAVMLVATLVAVGGLLRRHGLRACLPAIVLILSQALWFAVPLTLAFLGDATGASSPFAFIWVGLAHSVQYLWITSYYAKRRDERPASRFYVTALLAGAIVWVVPRYVFGPTVFGTLSFDFGLGALIASMVNLHHFIVDGAIWKLRDGRVARFLLRDTAEGETVEAPAEPRLLKPLVLTLGAVCLLASGLGLSAIAARPSAFASDDPAEIASVALSLRRAGLADPRLDVHLGNVREKGGDLVGAFEAFDESLEIQPTPAAWQGLGRVLDRQGQLEQALVAFTESLRLAPDDVTGLQRAASCHLRLGHRAEAVELMRRAVALKPGDPDVRFNMDLIENSKGPVY